MNIGVHIYFLIRFWFLQINDLGVELLDHVVVLFFFFLNFLRGLHIAFYSSCTNLHSHQQCMRVSFLSTYLNHLSFAVFLKIAILTHVR